MAEQTNPSGCRHCGIDKHGHLSQWAPHPVGWHTWVEPTMEQRKAAIKANLGRFTGKKLDRTEQEPKPEPAGFCCGCCDDEPEPDWADLREMARNAGWTPDTWMARDVHWGSRDPKRSLRTDLGWVSSRHFQGHHRVELHGPEPRPIRTAALIDPTPAEVLAAARLVGLGGAS